MNITFGREAHRSSSSRGKRACFYIYMQAGEPFLVPKTPSRSYTYHATADDPLKQILYINRGSFIWSGWAGEVAHGFRTSWHQAAISEHLSP